MEKFILRILERCRLEEARFGPRLTDTTISALERHVSLEYLSVGGGVSLDISKLDKLKDLEVEELTEAMARHIELGGRNLRRLKLGGSGALIASIRRSSMPLLSTLAVTSGEPVIPFVTNGRRDSDSLAAAMTDINPALDNTWDNSRLQTYLCGFPNDQVTKLRLIAPSSGPILQLPTCVLSWTNLTEYGSLFVNKPDLSRLPVSLVRFNIDYPPNVAMTPPFEPLDWSVLKRLVNLEVMSLSTNFLNTTLPPCISGDYTAPKLRSIDLHQNSVEGTIPANFFSCSPYLDDFTANADTRFPGRLTGTIPNFGFEKMVKLHLMDNHLTSWPAFDYKKDVPRNKAPYALVSMRLNGNPLVQIPDLSPLISPILLIFNDIPQADFCNTAYGAWNFRVSETCDLTNTNANECPEKYPTSCRITPLANPCTSPRPSPEFRCLEGSWTTTRPITSELITVAPNSQVVINGSHSPPSIELGGLNSSIFVSGCLQNLKRVTFDLAPSDIDKIIRDGNRFLTGNILTTDCDVPVQINSITPAVRKTGKKRCEKINVSWKRSSDSKSLSAFFSVNSTPCMTWWIILASVLCGLLLITVIVLVLVFTLNRSARECIRPHSRKRQRQAQA